VNDSHVDHLGVDETDRLPNKMMVIYPSIDADLNFQLPSWWNWIFHW